MFISMGMGMSMSIVQSQSLSLRQVMESKLQQTVTQKVVLEMRQYLQREDKSKKLYQRALERGDVRQYDGHGLPFEYARIQKQDLEELEATHLLDLGCGFAHCLYSGWDGFFFGKKMAMAKGSWLLFVVTDFFSVPFPEEYIQYVAIHEHGEEVTLGEHNLAIKLEFAIAKREQKISRYVCWWEEHSLVRFVDVFSHQSVIVLPDSEEFQEMLELKSKAEYAQRVRTMIEDFSWPYRVLQKLSRYNKLSQEVEGRLMGGLSVTVKAAQDLTLRHSISEALEILEAALEPFLRTAQENSQYICWPRLKEKYRELRRDVVAAFDVYCQQRIGMLLEEPQDEQVEKELNTLPAGGLPQDGILSSDPTIAFQALV